jgi:hypothetical protein
LRRGYLESLLVIIREHSESPDKMLERYTFTFEKSEISDGSQVISGIVMSDRKGTQVKMRDARRSLNDFVRKLINLCYNMPALPDRAKLSLEISYTENCPPEYHAPHFPHPGTSTARFPDDEHCGKQTVGVGKLNAGFHSVALKVSYLELALDDLDNISPNTNEGSHPVGVQIPSGLQYGSATDRFDDIDTDLSTYKEAVHPESSQSSYALSNSGSACDAQKPVEADRPLSQQVEAIGNLAQSPTPQQALLLSSSRQESEAVEATLQLHTKDSVAASRQVSTRAAHEREQLRSMVVSYFVTADRTSRY